MNKTTTRLLICSFLLLQNVQLWAQHLDWVDKKATPSRQDLRLIPSVPIPVCPDGIVTITDPPQPDHPGNYAYFYVQGNVDICYCGADQPDYPITVERTGQIFIVKRKFQVGGILQPYEETWSFYNPLQATISIPNTPTSASSCGVNDGSFTVVENSGNFSAMPREFKLFDLNGNQIGLSSGVVKQNSFTFNNLAPGSYKVKVSIVGCDNFAEQTVVIGGPTLNGSINGSSSICLGTGTQLTASGGGTYLWDNGSTNSSRLVTPSTAGTYTYTVTITANGCSVVRQHALTVNPSPSATISGPDKACYNNSVTLSNSTIGTYLWSTGATTSSINASLLQSTQTYNLTVTGTNGCQSSSSKTVSVLARPTLFGPNSICAGTSANLNVAGGTTYQWSTGETTASISPFPATTSSYSLTVTDANQCTYVSSKIVVVETIPDARIVGVTSTCAGQSVNLTAVGGSTYLWSTGASTASISVSPLSTTTYTVTATNSGGCAASSSHILLVKALPTGTISGPSTVCGGQAVSLTASGGSSYLWSTGATSASVSVNPSSTTTYTVSISNSEGCSVTKSHVLNLGLTGSASNNGPLTCTKTTVTLQSNTTAAGATYQWKNSGGSIISTNASTTVNTAGVYTLVMSEGACSYTTSTEVLLDRTNPNAVANNNGPITCSLPNVTLSGTSSTSGVSYQWKNSGGTVIANTANTTVNQTGVYTLRVTASNGCITDQNTTVSANLTTPNLSGVSNDGPLTCTKTSVTLSSNSSTSGVQYRWKNAASATISTSATAVVSTVGTYTIEVQAPNGCKTTSTTTVTQTGTTPNVSVNEPAAISCTEPQIWVSGGSSTSGVTYQWINQNNNVVSTQSGFNATIPGTYTLKVTAPNGCSNSASTTVADEMFLNFDLKLDGVNLGSTGSYHTRTLTCSKTSVSLGVVPPGGGGASYFFYLTNPQGGVSSVVAGQNKTLNQVGTYFIRMESSSGACIRIKEIKITQDITTPTIAVTGNRDICHNTSTSLSASGGSTYAWSTGATASTLSVGPLTSTTTYTVTVTGSNGCTANQQVVVTVNAKPTANAGAAQSICAGSSATLSGSAIGGTAAYTYLWSNGATGTTTSVSPAATTTYTLTVTDSKGCTGSSQVVLTVNPLPTLTLGADRAICAGTSTSLSAMSAGGTSPYSYAWSGGASTSSITVSPTTNTTYTLTLTDSKNCRAIDEVLITVNPALLANAGAGKQICNGESTQIEVTHTGGTAPFVYTWSTGATTSNLSVSPGVSTTYTVTVTDSKGCQSNTQRNVTVYAKPNLTNTIDQTICAGSIANLTAGASGGTTPYTYLWNNGATTASINVNPFSTTMYTVTVSDSHNCSTQTNKTVIVNATPIPQLSVNNSVICNGQSSILIAEGGSQFIWSNGATTSSITVSPIATTTYTVTISNAFNCGATTQATITVNQLPIPNIEGINTICAGQSTTLTATGGGTYAWQHGANTAVVTVSPTSTTTYKVTVTNAVGCSAIYDRTVSVNTLPSVQIGGLPSGPLCGTGSVVLTAISSTASSYRWSTNETSATITQALNASAGFGVTVKDINGCEASTGASVSVIPRPVAQIVGGDIPCWGNSTALTAIGGSSYLWSNNATTSSISISQPTQNQTYSVTVSNGPGCSSVAYKTVVVPAAFTLGYSLEKDQDCTSNNTQIVPVPHNAQGAVAYLLAPLHTFDFSTSLSDLGTGQYTLSAIDGKGCMADTMVVINEAPAFHVQANISGDTLDCLRGNVQVSLSSTGGRGSVSYHFDSPQSAILAPSSFSSSTLRRWVYAVDTVGCVDSVEVLVRDSIVSDLISDYTLAFDRDCIFGNAAITLQLSSAGATLPLSFQLNRETPTAQFHFDSLRAGYYLIRARYQDCRDSVAVLVDERIPRITGFQYLNQGDCKPNNTGVKLQAVSGWGTLRYQLDTRTAQDSSRFDSLAAGSHRFLVIDSLQCRDSLLIPINSEQPAYISVEDLVKCDSASGRISFRPNTQGVAAQYSIDGGKHWQTEVVFDSLPPGIYQPMRRKPSTGCIDSLNTVVLGRHCDTIPEAYFLQDIIRITEPNTSVLIRWEAKAPKWYRDTFYVKMKLEGDGFPHFNDGSRTNARTPELRGGEPLTGPNVYRYIGGGTHRDSFYLSMQDSAHLYTYPADYYFTLTTPLGGKTLVDPDRDITRVTVSLLGPDVIEEEVKVTLCKDCTTIGKDDVPGANCYYWPNFPNPGQKTQNVCSSGQFTRMALDENLVVIKKTVYTVKLSDLKVSIKEDFAVPRSCSPDENFLEAVATSTAEGPITFKWSTGATTQRIKLRSDVSTYTVTVTQGDCTAEASYTQEVENTACELKKYFEDNGFFAIPITNVQKQALHTPELRGDCPQPRGEANSKVKDFAGYTFQVNGGQVDPKSQLTQALSQFESVFGYSNGSGLITSNDEVCACPNYLKDKQAGFATQGGLQFWYHVFKADLSCPEASCDMLFIKAKMPNGKTYPAGGQDVAFLNTGYDFFSKVFENTGESLLTIVDDLCLDNFAAAKKPDMFEHKVPKKPLENLHLDLSGACWKGFNQAPVAVFTPSGELVMLPDNAVWRFRTPENIAYADGALTGFTKVTFSTLHELFEIEPQYISNYKPDPLSCAPPTALKIDIWVPKVNAKWTEIWEARTDPDAPSILKGYFRLNGLIGPFGFQQPTDAQEKSKVYIGEFDDIHGVAGNCGQFYNIFSAKLSDQAVFATFPMGPLVADLGTKGYDLKGERHYNLCLPDIKELAETVHKNSPDGAVYVYAKTMDGGTLPGLRYQFYDPVYGQSWAYLTPEGNGTKQTLWVWNCRLATWQEVKDEVECDRIRGQLTNIDKIWPILVERAKVHTGLELLSYVPLFGSGFQAANGIIYIKEGQVGRGVSEIVIAGVGLALEVPGINATIFAGRIGGAGQFITSLDAYKIGQIKLPPGKVAFGCNEVRYAVDIEILLDPKSLLKLGSKLGTAGATVLTKIDEGILKLIQNQDQGWPVIKWLNSMGADDASAEVAANILKKVFGELDFTVDEFAKLVGDFTNPTYGSDFLKAIRGDTELLRAWNVLKNNASRTKIDLLEMLSNDLKNIEVIELFLKSNPGKINEWINFDTYFNNLDDVYWSQFKNPPNVLIQIRTRALRALMEYPEEYVEAVVSLKASRISNSAELYTRTGADYGDDFFDFIDAFKASNIYGLTNAEIHAIFGYTTNFFYGDLNSFLRQGINSAQTAKITDLISSGLRKLPKYDGSIVYRGIEVKPPNVSDQLTGILNRYPKGGNVPHGEFISVGAEPNTKFMNDPNTRIRMTIQLKNNSSVKDISQLSDGVLYRGFPPPELIFPSNTTFEVIDVIYNSTGDFYVIFLKEL